MKLSKLILVLVLILLSAVTSVAQTNFYLDEQFNPQAKIPNDLVLLLRDEIKQMCPSASVNQNTDVNSWFSASRINLGHRRSAFILKSGKSCLTGADNKWFWIFLRTARGYQLVLTGGTISLWVLKSTTRGLRDIETNVATARTNYRNLYKFNGSVYKTYQCWESTPVEAKPQRVPCRT
jgi:hypothetical protein